MVVIQELCNRSIDRLALELPAKLSFGVIKRSLHTIILDYRRALSHFETSEPLSARAFSHKHARRPSTCVGDVDDRSRIGPHTIRHRRDRQALAHLSRQADVGLQLSNRSGS